ncbi:hypothetical protein DV736_g161, partial [Chaetothyriales sp. CBS 134916]
MTSPTIAPWKALFVEHLEHVGPSSAEFALATVTRDGAPRVRYCIHRGFWASLPDNPYNKLAKNPTIYESDCPVFTTDARMNKVLDIFASAKDSLSGSGGGGLIEAVYLFKHVMVQWRIRGKCWFLAADDLQGPSLEQNSGAATVKAEVAPFMRQKRGRDSQPLDWSWRLEVENQFENLSPAMRGTFKNPPPGQPIKDGRLGPGEGLGQQAGHLKDEPLARKNFRVAIITPDQVEQLDLGNSDRHRRFVWTRTEEHRPGGSDSFMHWTMAETWP